MSQLGGSTYPLCPFCAVRVPNPCLGPSEATYCKHMPPAPPLAREPTIPEPPSRGMSEFVLFPDEIASEDYVVAWADLPPVERARLRARGRSRLQEMGATEAELADAGVSLEAAGCLVRPHEMLPYEIERLKARGKVLARERGWDQTSHSEAPVEPSDPPSRGRSERS